MQMRPYRGRMTNAAPVMHLSKCQNHNHDESQLIHQVDLETTTLFGGEFTGGFGMAPLDINWRSKT